MQIYYRIEWAPHRGGPQSRPIGVWAIDDRNDLQFGFLRGYTERVEAAEGISRRLLSAGECLDPHEVLAEQMLEVPGGMSYCSPITHTDNYQSLTVCVQSVLGVIEKLWDPKKIRWRSGLKMPLERYGLSTDE